MTVSTELNEVLQSEHTHVATAKIEKSPHQDLRSPSCPVPISTSFLPSSH